MACPEVGLALTYRTEAYPGQKLRQRDVGLEQGARIPFAGREVGTNEQRQ